MTDRKVGQIVLIETLWNVKYYGVWRDAPFYVVLIETLWNVKLFIRFEIIEEKEVLIETLWNVKSELKNI